MSEQQQKQYVITEPRTADSFSSDENPVDTILDDKDQLQQLSHALQSTPDIKELIRIYSQNVQSIIPHSSISFENKLMDIDVSFGTIARHSCSYQLSFSKESLGRLTLTRNRIFNEDELYKFEDFLSALFYPLGRAIYD